MECGLYLYVSGSLKWLSAVRMGIVSHNSASQCIMLMSILYIEYRVYNQVGTQVEDLG